MENYVKSENKSEEPVQTSIHSINLDANVIHMNVKTGSKVTNLINFAQNKFEKDEFKQITWNATGDAMNKAIACAEIMKKKFKDLYQINKIGYTKTEEIWNSKLESLRDIKVIKEIPTICIILSKTHLDQSETGYQTENTIEDIFNKKHSNSNQPSNKSKQVNKLNTNDSEEIYVKKKKLNNSNKK